MVKTVGEASRFCVPTALALLTGFSRQAVVIGLRDKIRARNYNGGYMRSDYMNYLRTLPKTLVELGKTTEVRHYASELPPGLWLISGKVMGGEAQGHCYIIWNGLLFDNTFVGRPIPSNYFVYFRTEVFKSQMHIVIKKMAESYEKAA